MSTFLARTGFIFLLVLGLSGSLVAADQPVASELKLKTERVIVFKDGYCLVVKQGTATTDKNGFVFTKEVPDAAILGSFWGRFMSMSVCPTFVFVQSPVPWCLIQAYADSPSSENKIWRQVELINDTDLPWTTGAAMFVDGFQPLAQELLTYTSAGGICRVPVTVSVDLG